MCPACFSVAAAYVAGAGSIGGIATLFFKRFRRRERESARAEHPSIAHIPSNERPYRSRSS